MRDSVDPTAGEAGLAKMLRNVYPVDPQFGGAVLHRPGFFSIDGGAFSEGPVQCFHQFTKLNGTELTLAVSFGEIWKYDWTSGSWSYLLEDVDMTGGYSRSGPWYAVTFNDKVVFSDGYSSPFLADGTEHGGFTNLSTPLDARAFYGPPVVHYGKLFGILAGERSTMVWSEENSPSTGYESPGYNNSWTLLQTDTNRLVRLLPTNEALIVFRERSITAISGEVNENFSSTGTREAISSNIGTTSPDSVFFGGDDGELIFFTDAEGRPHVMEPLGNPVPIWMDARETLRRLDQRAFSKVIGYWDKSTEHAVFCYRAPGESFASVMLRYHVKGGTPQLACVWDGYDIVAVCPVENSSHEEVILHAQSTISGSDYLVHQHERPGGHIKDDNLTTTVEDSYNPSANNSQVLVSGGYTSMSASFTAATSGRLYEATWRLYRDAQTTGTVRAAIYAIAGSHGTTAVPTGSALATSDLVDVTSFGTSSYGTDIAFRFSGTNQYIFAAGTVYALVIELVSTSGGNVYVSQESGGIHAGNLAYYTAAGGWATSAAHDFAFSVKTATGQVTHTVEVHPQPHTDLVEMHFYRLDIMVRSRDEVLALYAHTRTAHGVSEAALVDFEDGTALWDEAVWDEDSFGYGEATRHGVLGIDAWGSSCGIVLTQTGLDMAFSLLTLTISGRSMGQDVRAR